jgi:hypothetical protein
MRIEFVRLETIFEFLPAITWYKWGMGDWLYQGSLTFSWLSFGIKIYYIKRR